MTFFECAIECMANKELVSEFNRLRGCKFLVDTRKPIERMVDDSCGVEREESDMGAFVGFVWDSVWTRVDLREENMKTISMRQPWGYLVSAGFKNVANKLYETSFRGELLIHSGKKWDKKYFTSKEGLNHQAMSDLFDYWNIPEIEIEEFRFGGIIGKVMMTDCVRNSRSPWAADGFCHWEFRDAIEVPLYKCNGNLGIFDIDYVNLAGVEIRDTAMDLLVRGYRVRIDYSIPQIFIEYPFKDDEGIFGPDETLRLLGEVPEKINTCDYVLWALKRDSMLEF